ncbi:MAG: DNA mismatch endonuclease Vsr [Bifidobacterium sp.]|nr:DNA mismatch endonuclease Vsr [Bifidobacterium sp.]
MDTVTPEQRSKIMSRIRSRDTKPELLVRKMLHANGYRFHVCDRRIAGHPDIVIPRCRTLIEVRGCFWHRHGWVWNGRKLVQETICREASSSPASNRKFWNEKFRRNVRRDAEHERLWAEEGWNLIVIWECALKPAEREKTFRFILRTLERWRLSS